jgi:hypothetical protein
MANMNTPSTEAAALSQIQAIVDTTFEKYRHVDDARDAHAFTNVGSSFAQWLL